MSIDVLDILNKFGLPIAALAVVVVFVWKGLWPFLMRNLEATQKLLEDQLAASQDERKQAMREFAEERKQAMREFTTAIAKRDDMAAQAARLNAEALNAMTSEIRKINQVDRTKPRGSK